MRRVTLSAAACGLVGCARLQSSFGQPRRPDSTFGGDARRGGGGGGGFGRPSAPAAAAAAAGAASVRLPPRVSLSAALERDVQGGRLTGPAPAMRANATNDDELSLAARAAMRDDAIILSALFRHIPQTGAISVKSLSAQLPAEVQEALSEQHGGLGAFLTQRKQFFLVRPRDDDGVLFVAANPLAAQKFAVRELQKTTMRQMLGLPREGERPDNRRGGFSRGGGSSGGGGGGRQYNNRSGSNSGGGGRGRSNFNNNGSSRGGNRQGGNAPQDRPYPRGGSGGNYNRGGGGGGGNRRPRDGPMGRQEQSFGAGRASR